MEPSLEQAAKRPTERPATGILKAAIFAAAALLLTAQPAAAYEVAGVKLPDTVQTQNATLQLNGAGLRTKYLMFDVYVIGLYVPTKTDNASTIIHDAAPRRVLMVMTRDLDTDTMVKAFHEGLDANSSAAERQSLKPAIGKLDALFKQHGAIKKGDRIELDFAAGGATSITVNGQSQGTIDDAQLSSALLSIWLGPHPVQNDLKKQLLHG